MNALSAGNASKSLLFVAALLLSVFLPARGEELPGRRGLVNDFAGVLSAPVEGQAQALAGELLRKADATLVAAVLPDLGGESVEGYAVKLYEEWGIGKEGVDRGVLLLVAVAERRVRIEVGYGLEGILPDGKVGEILDRFVLLSLREGDWESGVLLGMVALAQVIAADAGVELTGGVSLPARRAPRRSAGLFGFLPLLFFLLLLSRGGLLPWLIFPAMMGGGRFGRGGFGSFGGGGFGSFGGGGGGFSGFGGGLSGGGGASRGF